VFVSRAEGAYLYGADGAKRAHGAVHAAGDDARGAVEE
jgi:hypothetical protein